MKTFTLKVQDIIKETDDASTISFKQPALKKLGYRPGQYLTLLVNINGRRYFRPYSLSSCPGIDPDLRVTVKRVPGGIVSNHLIDRLAAGDMLEVVEAMGDFVLGEELKAAHKDIVLWGAGSGITPLMALLKDVLHHSPEHHVTLVYGNRRGETSIFLPEIAKLKNDFASRFTVWHFYTQLYIDSSDAFHVKGRIDPRKILDILIRDGHFDQSIHFICGPLGLKETVREELTALGIEPGLIFSEDFEMVRNAEDMKDVITREVQLVAAGETHSVEVIKGKSILEAALDKGIDLAYSCQTGSCKLCKGRIVAGDVKIVGPELTATGLEEGECLLCCAFPLSDTVSILALNT